MSIENVNTVALLALLVVAAALLLALGYYLRCRQTIIERSQLRARRRVLDIEWDGLRRVQQLGHLMYWSQERMREEEERVRIDNGGHGR